MPDKRIVEEINNMTDKELYQKQKTLLDTFLEHKAINKAQYDKSLGDLTRKMNIEVDESIIKPGRYRHYKGNEYEVICTARHSETEELMVVYKALYGDGDAWVRPASMWNEIVIKDGKEVRRFIYEG